MLLTPHFMDYVMIKECSCNTSFQQRNIKAQHTNKCAIPKSMYFNSPTNMYMIIDKLSSHSINVNTCLTGSGIEWINEFMFRCSISLCWLEMRRCICGIA